MDVAENDLPASPDVLGGIVAALVGLLHVFVLQLGGLLGVALLLVVWPLIGGVVAGRLSTGEDRHVDGALAGVFGALVTTLVVLLTGFAGVWPQFVTTTFGVSLWPVTFAVLLLLTVTWTVFGYAGSVLAGRAG